MTALIASTSARQKGAASSGLEPLDLRLRHEPSASHEKGTRPTADRRLEHLRSPAGLEPGAWDRPWTGARSLQLPGLGPPPRPVRAAVSLLRSRAFKLRKPCAQRAQAWPDSVFMVRKALNAAHLAANARETTAVVLI